ncbi:conserved hypothetical protein [Alkaliphilus metalliredigens QYMF]|uniref:Uncharacterized protein n=1 Tax=Alkaliphilus metalliredigens (strain QYMF) TaxID=293826 RepID=A6TV16_ALKMQ|nr:hypothetical protein [Alkaliphilus metalliredigens]ABR50034.1 conserved hypothetical protein [Alkaliphilus metalliredigens QYMF]
MTTPTKSIKSKLSLDLFYMQMQWSFWYISIILIIHLILQLVLPRFVPDVEEINLSFMIMFFQSSKIYMAIIGIIACYSFLPFFVKNGITRRDYFIGSSVAAVGVSFSILLVSAVITVVLQFLAPILGYSPNIVPVAFLDTTSLWIVPIISLSLIILCYYIAGWVIAVGFYRYNNLRRIGFIAIGLFYVSVTDLIWEGGLSHPLIAKLNIPFPDLSIGLSVGVTSLLIGLGLWFIRSLTKRIPIKL